MDHMEVRQRNEDDLPHLVELLKKVYDTSGYPVSGTENALAFLNSEDSIRALVLEDSGKIIGHAMITEAQSGDLRLQAWQDYLSKTGQADRDKFVALGRLFVDPSASGKGGGMQLVETAQYWTARTLGRRIVLNVLLKDPAAINIYRKADWTEYGSGVFTNQKGQRFDQLYFVSPTLDSMGFHST